MNDAANDAKLAGGNCRHYSSLIQCRDFLAKRANGLARTCRGFFPASTISEETTTRLSGISRIRRPCAQPNRGCRLAGDLCPYNRYVLYGPRAVAILARDFIITTKGTRFLLPFSDARRVFDLSNCGSFIRGAFYNVAKKRTRNIPRRRVIIPGEIRGSITLRWAILSTEKWSRVVGFRRAPTIFQM